MSIAHLTHPVHIHLKLPHWRILETLRHRRYLLFWSSTLISNLGTIIFVLALNWVVLKDYGSRGIAAVVLAYGLPQFILEIFGGAITDRYSRVSIMLITQSLMAVVAFLVAGLTTVGYTPLWLFVLANGVNGAISAFDSPARTVFITAIVPPEDVVDAQELYGTANNAMAIVGPALSGVLLVYDHVSLAFWINAISFIPILGVLPFIRGKHPLTSRDKPVLQSLGEGVNYITQTPDLRYLILLVAVIMILGMPYQTLLPMFTKNVLHEGASAYATLTSISGCGAFLGALGAALLSTVKSPGKILLGSSVIFGVALVLFSQSASLWNGVLLVLIASTAGNLVVTMNSGLSQLITPRLLQGRVASINFLYKGALSISASGASFLCHFWDLAHTQLIFAVGLLLSLFLLRPHLIRLNIKSS